jgi:hypothetical protein
MLALIDNLVPCCYSRDLSKDEFGRKLATLYEEIRRFRQELVAQRELFSEDAPCKECSLLPEYAVEQQKAFERSVKKGL